MKPEIFMFVDERIERTETTYRLIVGIIVVERGRWEAIHALAKGIGAAKRKKRLNRIADLLDHAGGFALLAYANLQVELVPSGKIDDTDDIPEMKRSDNVWSQAVLASIAAVLAYLRRSGMVGIDIDLYYDPKSLKPEHRDAYTMVLRKTLPHIAREHPETHAILEAPPFTFRQVEQVFKRQADANADGLQNGTSVADYLCSQAEILIDGPDIPRIIVRNHTKALASMVSKFS